MKGELMMCRIKKRCTSKVCLIMIHIIGACPNHYHSIIEKLRIKAKRVIHGKQLRSIIWKSYTWNWFTFLNWFTQNFHLRQTHYHLVWIGFVATYRIGENSCAIKNDTYWSNKFVSHFLKIIRMIIVIIDITTAFVGLGVKVAPVQQVMSWLEKAMVEFVYGH